jgi:molecular chaperone DnaK
MSNTKLIAGIDLGTSTTVVAYWKGIAVEVIPDPNNAQQTYTESVIQYFATGDPPVVGDAALNELPNSPDWVVLEAKRAMDTEQRFPRASGQYQAHEVLAEVLYYRLANLAPRAASMGADVIAAMISVPADYPDLAMKRTEEAWKIVEARLAQNPEFSRFTFEFHGLVAEPLAAAICHSTEHAGLLSGKPFLVLDLGGGTFDVTAYQTNIQQQNQCLSVNVLATDGEQRLGGSDWDQVLEDLWLEEAGRQLGHAVALPDLEPYEPYELKLECKRIRQNLAVNVSQVFKATAKGRSIRLTVTRQLFEQRSTALLAKLNQCIDRVLGHLKSNHHLDEQAFNVLLVGGASKMQMIQQAVQKRFPPAQVLPHYAPQDAVARGACIYCAIRNGISFPVEGLRHIRNINVVDILTRSYGIVGYNREGKFGMRVVLPRNTICDGSEYEYKDAALRETRDTTVRLGFAAIDRAEAQGDFVELDPEDPRTIIKEVQLAIPAGQQAVKGQEVHLYLRPSENGILRGRAQLMARDDPTQPVCDVPISFQL